MIKVSNFRFHMEGKTAKWVESYQDTKDARNIFFMEVVKEISQDPVRYLVVREDKLRDYFKMHQQETPERTQEIPKSEVPKHNGKV